MSRAGHCGVCKFVQFHSPLFFLPFLVSHPPTPSSSFLQPSSLVLREDLVPLPKSIVEKEAARARAEQHQKDKKDRVSKKRRRTERHMRRDRGAKSDSIDEDKDDEASVGSEFWAIPNTSLAMSTADSVLAFSGEVASDFLIVEEDNFLELPALFSRSISLVAFVSLSAKPLVGWLSGLPAREACPHWAHWWLLSGLLRRCPLLPPK